MIDFIPVPNYDDVFYNLLLFIVLLVYMQTKQQEIGNSVNLKGKNILGLFLLVFSIVYIGLRPITFSHFGDMGMYNIYFVNYLDGADLNLDGKDMGFELFMKGCSYIMEPQFFFLTIAFLYIFPFYIISKKLFRDFWFYGFFMLITSLSFWGSATNGLRNGLATSIFLFVFTTEKKYLQLLIILLAASFHKSLLITSGAFIAAMYYKDTKMYLRAWLLAIPLSLALGGFWESLFLTFGFGDDDKVTNYLIENDELVEKFSSTGFRWDFLLYSATGVFAGWYYIYRKNFDDELYKHMFNTYLIANGFWILVIRANYSNRFAYLSWFVLALIIIYPLLKSKLFTKQHVLVGNIILFYFLFTYLLNIVFSKY